MRVYGQTIAEVHHWYWKFLKVPGSNKTLNLASYFCLEVGGGHVFWDEVIVLFQSVDCFTDKLSLICLWKRGNDLAHPIVLLHQNLVKLPVTPFVTLPGRTTSQVMAEVWPLPMPETAAGEDESILVSSRPSVMISSNQGLMVAPESNTVRIRLPLLP